MSDLRCIIQTVEVALSAAASKTVLQLAAPLNQRVKVTGWGVFFDGTSVTAEPVQVRLLRQSSAGTMSGVTPAGINIFTETIQSSALFNASVEPVAADVLDVIEVHPQSGYEVKFPLGCEVIIPGGGRLGIECTSPSVVNVRAKLFFEE
jgi:hypothetical protein